MTAVPMPEAVAKVEDGLLAWHITDPFAHVDTNLLRGRDAYATERKRFEAWLTNVYFSGLEGAGDWDEARNCYVRLDTHMAWKGWQAALMSRQAPATLTDEQCDEFRRHPGTFRDMVRHIYRAGKEAT